MFEKIKQFIDTDWKVLLQLVAVAGVVVFAYLVMLAGTRVIMGDKPDKKPAPVTALTANDTRPVSLAPGQTAMLLKEIVVPARIPFNGDELYVGEVRIHKGTMLVKPKVE